MANRDLTTFRSNIQQTADVSTEQAFSEMASIGQKIIATGQEAKITENFSKAQLELNQLNQQYQIDYEGDPFGGLDDLKQKRDEIFSKYGEQISPFFRGGWESNTRDLALKNDATVEAWAYKQTRVNTVKSINTSIKNNMSQAAIDGQNFGTSDEDEIGSMLNFAQSKKQLANFGDKHLGAETTTEMLESYDGDYLKSFISGVSETNPLKALRLMEKDEVKNGFKDKAQYLKMKDAVENRALNVEKIMGEKQVLGVLKDENSILTKSLEQNVSYSDLQQAFEKGNLSPAAQSFFLKANGFSARGEGKISQSEQLKNKAQLYSEMTQVMAKPDLTTGEISEFQNKIYNAMDNGTLNEKEGLNFINQLSEPLIAQKEEQFKTFGENNWISPDVGFGGLQEVFAEKYEIQPSEDQEEAGAVSQSINDARKVKLYDYYMSALQTQAASYNIPISEIKNLDKPQQRKLYADAQADAERLFQVDENPKLSTLNDLPNQTFSGGKLIQGAAGDRQLKPDAVVNPTFKPLKGSDGFIYREYEDGTMEQAGRWK